MGLSDMSAMKARDDIAFLEHTCLIKLEDNVFEVVDVGALLVLQFLSHPLPLHFPQRLQCSLTCQDIPAP